jgi:hypothetical protein
LRGCSGDVQDPVAAAVQDPLAAVSGSRGVGLACREARGAGRRQPHRKSSQLSAPAAAVEGSVRRRAAVGAAGGKGKQCER